MLNYEDFEDAIDNLIIYNVKFDGEDYFFSRSYREKLKKIYDDTIHNNAIQ